MKSGASSKKEGTNTSTQWSLPGHNRDEKDERLEYRDLATARCDRAVSLWCRQAAYGMARTL